MTRSESLKTGAFSMTGIAAFALLFPSSENSLSFVLLASDMDFLAAENHALIIIRARPISTPHKGIIGSSDILLFLLSKHVHLSYRLSHFDS